MKKLLAAIIGFTVGFVLVYNLTGCGGPNEYPSGANTAPSGSPVVVSPVVATSEAAPSPQPSNLLPNDHNEVYMAKFTVVNDRKVVMNLRILDIHQDRTVIIHPGQMMTVELTLPDNGHIYFKVWENHQALVSYYE